MPVVTRDIRARSALSRTGIPGGRWCLNPYVGCAHACRYCYAEFMRKYTGHAEPWGAFVDARVNAPELLAREAARAAPGRVILGTVTDAYQPLEASRGLTRRCLEVLSAAGFPVTILTKSPLVLRDADLLKRMPGMVVSLTITTDDERLRRAFEPGAPPVAERVRALRELSEAGIDTRVFIGPVLPLDPEVLAAMIGDAPSRVMVDRMNYPWKTRSLYRRLGLAGWLEEETLEENLGRLAGAFADLGVPFDRASTGQEGA